MVNTIYSNDNMPLIAASARKRASQRSDTKRNDVVRMMNVQCLTYTG
jgi:hypothetical protein